LLTQPNDPTHIHTPYTHTCAHTHRLKTETASLKEAIAARSAEAAQLGELRDKDYDKALGKAKGKEEALSKELVKVGCGRVEALACVLVSDIGH
jgi:hypothetical protein